MLIPLPKASEVERHGAKRRDGIWAQSSARAQEKDNEELARPMDDDHAVACLQQPRPFFGKLWVRQMISTAAG